MDLFSLEKEDDEDLDLLGWKVDESDRKDDCCMR